MRAHMTIIFLLGFLLLWILFVAASFTAQSGKNEGRPNGMTYAAVLSEINRHEAALDDASLLFRLDSRTLGAAIAAERAYNFLPIAEDFIDAVFGTSVGFSQVNTVTFKEVLAELILSDSCFHFSADIRDVEQWRTLFRPALGMKRYERKLLLLFDTRMNIHAAAMILRHSLDRYNALAPQLDVRHRPDLAATLYHRTFPDSIRGVADSFGQMAMRFYHDPSFMPCSLPQTMVSNGRQH